MFRPVVAFLIVVAGCGGTDAPASLSSALSSDPSTSSLSSVCPATRDDALCAALRAGRYQEAGQLVSARIAVETRPAVLTDAAVRWWARERAVALLSWNAAPSGSDAFVAEHFPAYAPGSFPLARAPWAPSLHSTSCSQPTEALILFVGVLRSETRHEFDRQTAALRNTFPCLRTARVEYDSFVAAGPNAAQARALIADLDAELGPVPLHFLGYSQGVYNALRTLTDYPELAPRTRTFVSMSSAAHGSETADALLAALGLVDKPAATCEQLPPFARKACRAVDSHRLHPISDFLGSGVQALGFDGGDLDGETVGDFLRQRIAGLRSLGTLETAQFWRERGAQLPTSTLYLSFRSFIGDLARDLPPSNAWSYMLLAAVDPTRADNDMQVRLVNQPLGGPLADVEVVAPAAEGNHWQWELTSDDLAEALEPRAMAERMPHEALLLGYYQTLHELGLFVP
jgi:pimeloyl-ACP methyl ester carboxylesterase